MALILDNYYMTKKFSHHYDVYKNYYQCHEKITRVLSTLVIYKQYIIFISKNYLLKKLAGEIRFTFLIDIINGISNVPKGSVRIGIEV